MLFFKPSALEEFMVKLPLKWQIIALQVAIEETERWERGDLTSEEQRSINNMKRLGEIAAKQKEDIILMIFNNDKR